MTYMCASAYKLLSAPRLAYMVEVLGFEDSIPAILAGKVLYNSNVKMAFPLGMECEDLVAGSGSADSSRHFMALPDQSLDNVGSHEGVGPSDKCGWHCACFCGATVRLRVDVESD